MFYLDRFWPIFNSKPKKEFMDNKITPLQIQVKETVQKPFTLLEGTLPFNEKLAVDHTFVHKDDLNKGICASDLFSFFTADVIKEEVVFTR